MVVVACEVVGGGGGGGEVVVVVVCGWRGCGGNWSSLVKGCGGGLFEA